MPKLSMTIAVWLVGRRLKDVALEREPFHAGKQIRKKVAPVPDFSGDAEHVVHRVEAGRLADEE